MEDDAGSTQAAGADGLTAAPVSARADESSAAGDVRERVRDAVQRGARCRVAGAGLWLDAGRPVSADVRIDLRAHSGIVEYVPGDLTLTALAGTTLEELERVTAAERQWLPLDPFGSPGGTLGATIASASAGPLSHGFGAVRDNVLGLEVVTGRGEIVRAGGRVVKNVAGFDLVRLMVGAWGTLGAITEVTVRLRARPEVDRTVLLPLPSGTDGLESLLGEVRRAPFAPLAAQLVNGPLARKLGIAPEPCLLVRLGGNEAAVRTQHDILGRALASSGATTDADVGARGIADAPSTIWSALRECEPRDAVVLRLAASPAVLPFLWTAAADAAAEVEGTLVHGWCGSGTVRLVIPIRSRENAAQEMNVLVRALPEARRLGERLPAELWPRLVPSAVDDELSRRMRAAFDPHLLLNPGILGEATS